MLTARLLPVLMVVLIGLTPCSAMAQENFYDALRRDITGRGIDEPTFLLGDAEAAAWKTFNLYGSEAGRASATPIEPAPGEHGFRHAVRIDTGRQTAQPWSVIWGSRGFERPIRKGDTVLAVIHLRGVDSGLLQGVQGVVVLKDSRQLMRSSVAPPEGQWKRYYLATTLSRDVNMDEARLEIFLGGSFQQTLDIGGIAVMNLGQGVDRDALPRTQHDYDYAGREPGAAWRQAALERIEQIRKGDLTVVVQDAAGNPVPDAQVQVQMTRHAFLWGSIIQPEFMFDDTAEARKARAVFLDNFNAVTENFKWPAWDGRGFKGADKSTVQARLDWAKQHDLPVHGHTPLWHRFGVMPFNPDKHSKEEIRQGILDFLHEVLTWPGVREGVDSWDAINHPFVFSDVWRHVGRDIMLEEMRTYRQLVPEHKLFINEGGVLTGPGRNHLLMVDLVDWIMQEGAPIDGVGFMGHFGPSDVTAPEELLRRFDAYRDVAKKHAGYDLELKITEFDMTADPSDPAQVALRDDYTRDFLITVFSYPAFQSFVQWGFWDGKHWRGGAGLYDKNWNLKSNGQVYRDLVFNQWWTDEAGPTDDTGRFTARGFLGDYRITATLPSGVTRTVEVSLPREGQTVTLQP